MKEEEQLKKTLLVVGTGRARCCPNRYCLLSSGGAMTACDPGSTGLGFDSLLLLLLSVSFQGDGPAVSSQNSVNGYKNFFLDLQVVLRSTY